MLKFSFRNVLVSAEFWHLLCEVLLALGTLISAVIDSADNDTGNESVGD